MELYVRKITPLEKGRARILFDNGVEAVLYKSEMRKLSLREGSTVTEETYRIIMSEILGKRAKKRAMYLLERQDRTEKQLYDKLCQNGYPKECVTEAVEYVKSYHYIDDLRYARTYIRFHQEKKSRQKLKLDLLTKGVNRNTIEQALEEEFELDESEKITELLRKRRYQGEMADENEKRRIYQFLMRRGFKSSDILRAMNEYKG